MQSTWFRYLPALGVLLAGAFTGFHLQRSLRSAETELERRHSVTRMRQTDPAEPSGGPPEPVAPEELRRLRAAHLELLHLRGSIEELRATATTVADPTTEVSALEARATELRAEMEQRRRQRDALLEGRQMRDAATMASILVSVAAQSSAGRIPAGWHDVEALARRSPTPATGNPPTASVAELWDQCRSESVPLDRFEILAAGRRDGGRPRPRVERFVVRERVAREVPSPKGGWVRWYAFAGGDVMEATSPDGTFSAWEREHLDVGPDPNGPSADNTPPRAP